MKKPVYLCYIMSYYELNVYVSPNSYVEILTSNEIVFKDGAFGR